MSKQFEADNYLGSKAQPAIAHFLADLIGASGVRHTRGKVTEFDFTMERKGWEYPTEVKTDFRAAQTRNVFFETGHYNGSNTGLTATTAFRWVYYLPHLDLLATFPPGEMLEYLAENEQLPRKYGVGDGNANGITMPISHLTGLSFVNTYHFPKEKISHY